MGSSSILATIADHPFKTAAKLFGALRAGYAVALQSDRDPIQAIMDQQTD